MHLIKKFFLALALFSLSMGCSSKREESSLNRWMQNSGKVKILSTIAQIGDLVSAVGGDRIESLVLITAELDPHSYELVKGDGEKFERADLIFYNGLGLEHGASLSQLLTSSSQSVSLGEKIVEKKPEKILYKEGVIDPHIWMDVALWSENIESIVKELTILDPEGEAYYIQRGQSLLEEMKKLHSDLLFLFERVPSNKKYLVTSHDAFRYFTKAYLASPEEINWEERFAAPEGLAPDGQLNPKNIQQIIDFLQLHNISVLFPESNVSRDSILKIMTSGNLVGLQLRLCSQPLYGDSMCGLSYSEMMRHNAEVIVSHL
jgi:manganese/zinc/iron transport system substrate-binding protein